MCGIIRHLGSEIGWNGNKHSQHRLKSPLCSSVSTYWKLIADNLSKTGELGGCELPVVVMLRENRRNMLFQKVCNALVGIDLVLNF